LRFCVPKPLRRSRKEYFAHGFGYGADTGFAADVNLTNFDWATLKARLPGISDSVIALAALIPETEGNDSPWLLLRG
jgi:hypothetical protein